MQLNEEVLGKDDCRHDEYVWGDDKTVTQWGKYHDLYLNTDVLLLVAVW